MNDLQCVLQSCKALVRDIKAILIASTYSEYDDMSGLKIDYTDPEQLFVLDEMRAIMENLSDAYSGITYLSSPVKNNGVLRKNSRERYETDTKEYTSGCCIEALVYDADTECNRWVKTSVEHNGTDYYLVRWPEVSMEGLKVRER